MLHAPRRALGLATIMLAACSGGSAPAPEVPRVDAARSTLTASPRSATGDGLAAVTLTATARDASGAPLPGRAATFLVNGESMLSPSSATTGGDGAATVTLTSTVAGDKDVSVSIDGVTVTAHATVTFVAGPAAALTFAVPPADAVAGELLAPVRIVVADRFGNAVAAATDIAVRLTGDPAGAELLGTVAAVATGGSADFADLSIRAAGTGYRLLASTTGLPDVTSGAFSISPAAPDAATSDVAADPASLPAGATSNLAATVRDAFGNPVPGGTVTFGATPGTGNTLSSPAITDATGVASGTLSSTKAETKTVTATVGSLALSDHPFVTFAPGAPDPGHCSLVASPASVPDDGTRIALSATVTDAYGNPVAGETVTFSSSGAADFSQSASVTRADGTATSAVSASAAGVQTIRANVGAALIAQVDVTFTAIPSASASTVQVAPSSVPANGTMAATVTVTVKEALGQPVVGATVALAYSGTAAISPPSATTSVSGVATFSARSSTPGTGTLTATVNLGGGQTVLADHPALEFVAPPTYAIGGAISGLTAGGLVLATAGEPDLTVLGGATAFAFADKVPSGTAYAVSVKAQPAGQRCVVLNGAGTVANGDVTDVVVECRPYPPFPPLTWTWVPIDGSVCSDGSPTGIGIEIGPSASPDVLVFLDGGGACWDYLTCWVYWAASPGPFGATEFAARITARGGSVLDRSAPGNPYADATFVFIPYCTGDVHSGATTRTYAPAIQAWHHAGHVNVSNAFAYLAAMLDAPVKVVVSGSSAGGFGSLGAFKVAKAAWPGSKGYLVDDSGPPLAAIPTATVAAWYASWDLGAVVADVCGAPCATDPPTLAPIIPALAAAYPTDRFALLSSTQDAVIRAFFADPATLQPMDAVTFEASLRDLAAAMEDDTPDVPPAETHAFLVTGTTHPMLDRPASFTSEGVPLFEWLRRQVQDDAAWAAAIPPPP